MDIKHKVAILFGPQIPDIDEALSCIQSYLFEHPSAGFLVDVVRELPSLWPVITSSWPVLAQIPGDEQLAGLKGFFDGGPPPVATELMNVLVTPVTVIWQIVEFLKLKDTFFMAATAVASSPDEAEFRAAVSAVIRLAVCIGSLVDWDELEFGRTRSMALRWKTAEGYDSLKQTLLSYSGAYVSCITDANRATVTVPEGQAPQMMHSLVNDGFSVRSISLCGRFHHQDHAAAVERILKLCEEDHRFRLPQAQSLAFPLRSNVDGESIRAGKLHQIVLQSILSLQSQWYTTVSATLQSMGTEAEDIRLVVIGPKQCLPREALRLPTSKWNGDSLESPGSESSSENITPSSTSSPGRTNRESAFNNTTVQPIAVTGMACRYPQADSVEALWDLLELGKCTVSPMPNERFKIAELLREPKGPFWGNYLEAPDIFDHRFFNISAREAAAMDPQQRLLLHVAYEAMESAGYCGLRGTQLPPDIGCYVGVGADDYTENVGSHHANAYSATGSLQAFNSGRISHLFGWSGPSVVVDTACSSAAVAIHLACQALYIKDCSIAVAGGVNVMTSPRVTQNLAAASFLSPTGASKAFDADANGYCRSEGAELIVLRPLDDALRDGDSVLAVITGTAVNQGSNCSPITVPVSESQVTLYHKALAASRINPEEISYVEAHGTGTQVGDPIEFDSIRKTFGNPHREQKLYVGSIKDNIGHTGTSSGVASLIKTVLMMQKRRIPKQANFSCLNPKIPSPDVDRIFIPQQSADWISARRVALVTNYGAAGSNAAIVLHEHNVGSHRHSRQLSDAPIFIAAKSIDSLRSYCRSLHTYINSGTGLVANMVGDFAYNLAVKQNRNLDFFISFPTACQDTGQLLNQLESVSSGMTTIAKRPAQHLPELYASCQLVQTHLASCEDVCLALGLPSLFPNIFQMQPVLDLVNLHCILFSVQYTSAKSWIDSGLQVSCMIGHSFGQLTALCVAGGLTLMDGIRLVSQRARLLQTSWSGDHGSMLAVEASQEEVQQLVVRASNSIDMACYNGPRSFVLAGNGPSIQSVERIADGLRIRRLPNTHAFHSRLVDSIVPGLQEVADSLHYQPTAIPVEPCSQDGLWTHVTPSQIVSHSRMPVYFSSAVQRAAHQAPGGAIWLEAGSASPVIPMVRRVLEASLLSSGSHVYQSIDLRGPQVMANLAKATSLLWDKSISVQFWPFHRYQASDFSPLILPPYQFAKTSHWTEYNPRAFLPAPTQVTPDSPAVIEFVQLLEKLPGNCLFTINTKDPLYRNCTEGHAVVDQNLCPAPLYLEIIVRAATSLSTTDIWETMPHLEGLSISAPLVLDPEGDVLLRLCDSQGAKDRWEFTLFTQQKPEDTVTHATRSVALHPIDSASPIVSRFRSLNRLMSPSRDTSIEEPASSCGFKGSTVYQAFRRVVNYADYYRGVQKVFALAHEATGLVSVGSSLTKESTCDPILVGNFVQVAGIHVNCLSGIPENEVYVCSAIGDFFLGEEFVKRDKTASLSWNVYSNYDRLSEHQIVCDVFVMDQQSGKLAVAIMAATFTSVTIRSLARALAVLNRQKPSIPDAKDASADDKRIVPIDPAPVLSSHGEDKLLAVQQMLSSLLGTSPDELTLSSSLLEIGVDSLMSTEVLTEIKKQFNVQITSSALGEIADVHALAQAIFPGYSGPKEPVLREEASIPEIHGATQVHQPPDLKASPILVQEAHDLFATIRTNEDHSQATQWNGFCRSVFPKQVALVTAYVVEAFRELGHPLDSMRPGDVVSPIPVLPQHENLRHQLYGVLEYSNLIVRSDERILRTAEPVPNTSALDLYREIIDQYPHHASEHTLLRNTGSQLAKCLVGSVDPLALLFHDPEVRKLIGDVYANGPMFKSATMHMSQYLQILLTRLRRQDKIRVLEIGAGTGGTTAYLVDQLAAVPEARFEYTFTDITPSLVALARKRFREHDSMQYMTLNIEEDPPSQLLGQYDIIISTNCIHATHNITHSCINVRKLLRPYGILCLVEATRNLFWFDLVSGFFEGWWLFNDGRTYALASEHQWEEALHQAGYHWGTIPRNPTAPFCLDTQETVQYGEKDGVQLMADIYYPSQRDGPTCRRPIALLIHGGGHVMLSRKMIRPPQTKMLLDSGFLPVSIDYRLCPEASLRGGPMQDVCDALAWARQTLPTLTLQRPDIRPDGDQVVAVGWSTGGHLAMSLAWASTEGGIRAPEAVLAFYCPTDYRDPFWSRPNYPYGQKAVSPRDSDASIWDDVGDNPITGYNPPSKGTLGGWICPTDRRSRIVLHMNWKGQTLPVLLHGWKHKSDKTRERDALLPHPTAEEIREVCPRSQIEAGNYRTPAFTIACALDNLIPLQQAEGTYARMLAKGVDAKLKILDTSEHLFDILPSYRDRDYELQAVVDSYRFLSDHVRV
ncbi:putative polyketide synthase [Aspergillus avenaceus]|uniref:Putative polyketide synthase n=1 Tax=Aspergillus avenaceus TaxID=36643 RepID=A0A5N6U8W1_ASPAV|nr:putative polyketide synthase [Aspergillus avenaceus]